MQNLRTNTILTILAITILSCDKRPSDHFVEINGKKQHVLELGEGEPTVVFIAGSGSKLTHFDSVQKEISKVSKTFSYDKPGLGKSEMIDAPRTVENMTYELNEIIEKENLKGPFVLVGHSLGGFIARYFLHLYPEKVIGLVLIDPGNEYLFDATMKTEKERRFVDSLINVMANDNGQPVGAQMESKYFHEHDSIMKTVDTKTKIPITLLESNKVVEEDLMTADVVAIKKGLYRDFQRKLPQTKIVSTSKSGHFIQMEEPLLVINEIKLILEKVR